MGQGKPSREWGKLYFELSREERLAARGLVLLKKWEPRRRWEFLLSPAELILLGDQRNPKKSNPGLGRRMTDRG